MHNLQAKIAEIELEDGEKFYEDKIEIDEINKFADFSGLRVLLLACVGGDHQRLQIDIGFGVVRGPVEIN